MKCAPSFSTFVSAITSLVFTLELERLVKERSEVLEESNRRWKVLGEVG